MAKQAQKTAAILLGLAAILLAAGVVFLFGSRRHGADTALAPAVPPAVSARAFVDLNEADLPELCSLPGIGEVLAQRIIEQREEAGPFRSRDDVLAVSGIGEATWEGIEPYITFGTQDGDT